MTLYETKFDIEIEKLNELENLCKEFNLKKRNSSWALQIYQKGRLLVQEKFTEDKVKVLIVSTNKKIYEKFMEKVNEFYKISEN